MSATAPIDRVLLADGTRNRRHLAIGKDPGAGSLRRMWKNAQAIERGYENE